MSKQLAMHVAAMKPSFLNKKEVPAEDKEKYILEGGEKALWKMYKQSVMMEQEFAMLEDSTNVKTFLREREAEKGFSIKIQDWNLFKI